MSAHEEPQPDLDHAKLTHGALEEWLGGRQTPHLSTNAGSLEIAFQGWRRFKEAFAPELVIQAVDETSVSLGRRVRTCLDPFGGSGTTSLTCQFLAIKPTTVEVNPYLADLVEAKLARYDLDLLIRDMKRVLRPIDQRSHAPFPGAPLTFVQPGKGGSYLFGRTVARRLATLRSRILRLRNDDNRRLLRVLLGGVAVSVSNVVVSGKGRRYRRNWEQRRIGKSEVDRQLVASVTRAVYEIARFRDRGNTDYVVLRGDARQLVPKLGAFDLAVFSPPYPNSFDYTDVYNIELWVCGYLKRPSDNRTLRLETLTSHVQIARSYAKPKIASPTLAGVVNRLRKVRQRLWNRNIPDMVEAYFADMEEILRAIRTKLVPGGRAYIVVGDSQYAGIQIPVSTILTEFASHLGYSVVYERPFRSMRLSPQQGGRAELPETLLALARMR